MSDLEKRIMSLEKKLRRTRNLMLLLAVVAASITIVAAAGVPDKIICKEINIVDAQGKVRVLIGADMKDAHILKAGTGLSVLKADGTYLTGIGEGALGWGVAAADAQGRPKTGIGITAWGDGMVVLDDAGKLKLRVAEFKDELGLSIYKSGEKLVLSAGTAPIGTGFTAYTDDMRYGTGAGITNGVGVGFGVLDMQSQKYLTAIGVPVNTTEPVLGLFGSDGKLIFGQPKGFKFNNSIPMPSGQ